MNANILLTPPVAEPVTLDEVKAHARIESSADDALLTALIKASREWCEAYTRRAFLRQTWCLMVSKLPASETLILPRAPLLAVGSVQVFDEDDQSTLWDSENYYVDTARQPGALVLRSGAVWPSSMRCANGLIVTYDAGYGADASAVPEDIKLAVKQLALHWYEHRGEASTSQTYAKAPLTIEALLQTYRVVSMGVA